MSLLTSYVRCRAEQMFEPVLRVSSFKEPAGRVEEGWCMRTLPRWSLSTGRTRPRRGACRNPDRIFLVRMTTLPLL